MQQTIATKAVTHSTPVEERFSNHNGKLFIETVGCQMNLLDSELVVGALRNTGYELTNDIDEAETLLFNTCSVREHAEHKIYSFLGRLKYRKLRQPNCVIGVMGCMAQKDQELIFQRAPHVDLVVGTGQLGAIPKLIDEVRGQIKPRELAVSLGRHDGKRQEVSGSFQSYDPLREPQMRPSPYQAFVRIMIGCDKFCTYCVVPSTRGPEQSRSPKEIVSEVRVLADQGVREVTLLGQTVNSYKYKDGGTTSRLSDLLTLIHDIPDIQRIKFITSYPRDMGNDLLHAVNDLPKVAHYLHVPLQSGCNDVLKVMKRGYTVEIYREMMQRINEIIPGCAVSSDFIVGNPGETEESFQRSMDSIREFRFKNSFIFKYSPRPGTKAFELLPDDVPEDVKKRRNNELLDLQNQISAEDNAAFIGSDVEILVEGPSKTAVKEQQRESQQQEQQRAAELAEQSVQVVTLELPKTATAAESKPPKTFANSESAESDVPQQLRQQLVGRTRCDRIVVFDGNPRLTGHLVNITINDCTQTTLLGSIITQQIQHGSSNLLPIMQ